jgi:hypothetical protein
MSEFIFSNDSSIFNTKKDSDDTKEISYTLTGTEDHCDENGCPIIKDNESEGVFAKKILRKNGTAKFMVRLGSNGKLFNPVSIYGLEKDKTFLDRICRSNSKFKEVNHKVFDLYVKFLQSKNISWLNNAEREAE